MCSFIFKINLNQENPVTLEEDKVPSRTTARVGHICLTTFLLRQASPSWPAILYIPIYHGNVTLSSTNVEPQAYQNHQHRL